MNFLTHLNSLKELKQWLKHNCYCC